MVGAAILMEKFCPINAHSQVPQCTANSDEVRDRQNDVNAHSRSPIK